MLKLEEWAASGWRPCCGRCREPVLTVDRRDEPCGSCGAAWHGAEASEEEARYRLDRFRERAAARRDWGPRAGKCEDCGRIGARVEVPWVGITGTNEGKSVCLLCAPPYVVDERSPTQSLEDGAVGLVVGVASRRQPGSPAGWIIGVGVTVLILKDKLGRDGIERIFNATLDNVFGVVRREPS